LITGETMLPNVDKYLNAIKADFAKFYEDAEDKQYAASRIQEFNDGLEIVEGSKYLKIVKNSGSQRSVHSFICVKDNGKFKAGDVLKAASWAAPARNFARANLFVGDFSKVRWTGVM